jgi:hypothetical protein
LRTTEETKSPPNWAAEREQQQEAEPHPRGATPLIAKTAAGPTANHALPKPSRSRCPVASSAGPTPGRPGEDDGATTASGTSAAGKHE